MPLKRVKKSDRRNGDKNKLRVKHLITTSKSLFESLTFFSSQNHQGLFIPHKIAYFYKNNKPKSGFHHMNEIHELQYSTHHYCPVFLF